jgi:HAD superfamily hydrolase (TIGR01490 family)
MNRLALFDLDHTLHADGLGPLNGASSPCTMGWRDEGGFGQANDVFYEQYKAGTLDIADYIRFAVEAIREQGASKSAAPMPTSCARCGSARPHATDALELVRKHQQAGDRVVIVTATNEFVTRPIAEAFGVKHLIAIELERDARNGWITGEIRGTPSFREGKVVRVEQWLLNVGWTGADVHSTFYSDSINDLPLLEKVTHPVATNPDDRLRAVAEARGWRILDLFS